MCNSCLKRDIFNGDAIELYSDAIDPLTGDATYQLEYAVPSPRRPVQPVHRVERPVAAPEPQFVTEKPCQTCPAVLRLRDYVRGESDFDFRQGERDFEWAKYCAWCEHVIGYIWQDVTERPFTSAHIKAWEAANPELAAHQRKYVRS